MDKRKYLKKILDYIPSGAQTLSKNPSQYVIGVTPPVIKKAKGVYFWDADNKKYLDTLLALGPMIFGYANPRIDRAVKKQIDLGTIYSLPSEKELELAKLLRKVVPCAQMSRFVLNGNDATSGAVRLARHVTQRDHIAKCGYHGWQDWSICTKTGRNNGIPGIIKTMTHDFKYNDIESLKQIFKKHKDQIAAVILEPVSDEAPKDNFLQKVKKLTHQNGAILIFDELVTGFRWSLGGAQEYFNVIPDIACFGKAISNGYPVAAICGKTEYMKRMDEIFVSVTFGGFIPGLVASIECIKMMREMKNVHKYMHQLGVYFIEESNKIIKSRGLPLEFVGFGPHPIMKILIKDDYQSRIVKTFIYQEMNKAGILFSSSMTIGYKHTKKDIDLIIKKFKSIGDQLAAYKEDYQKLEQVLEGEIVAPRTVRNIQ